MIIPRNNEPGLRIQSPVVNYVSFPKTRQPVIIVTDSVRTASAFSQLY